MADNLQGFSKVGEFVPTVHKMFHIIWYLFAPIVKYYANLNKSVKSEKESKTFEVEDQLCPE